MIELITAEDFSEACEADIRKIYKILKIKKTNQYQELFLNMFETFRHVEITQTIRRVFFYNPPIDERFYYSGIQIDYMELDDAEYRVEYYSTTCIRWSGTTEESTVMPRYLYRKIKEYYNNYIKEIQENN